MDPFTIATIAANIGGSILSGNSAKKAAKRAAALQAQASSAALGYQRNANQQATAYYTPYVQEGDQARTSYNALLGIGTQQTRAPTQDYAAYRARWEPTTRNNPTSPFHAMVSGLNPSDPDYDRKWAEAYQSFTGQPIGFKEGEAAPMPSDTDVAAARDKAYSNFNASPYAVAANLGAEKAQQAIMGSAGAKSHVLSGRTVNATQNNATQYKANAMLDYMNQLNGIASRGYDAAGGIVGAGQTFANNAGNILMQGAQQQGSAMQAGSEAQSSGIGQGLTLAAWLAGQRGGNTGNPMGSSKTGSFSKAPTSLNTPNPNALMKLHPGGL